jgi:hypothetical protein
MEKIVLTKLSIYLSLGLPKGRPGYRKCLQPLTENLQHLQKIKFIEFFQFLLVTFALLYPDLIRIQSGQWIRNQIFFCL